MANQHNTALAARDEEVLAAMRWYIYNAVAPQVTPTTLARALNAFPTLPCPWCPVLPPLKGHLSVVPVNSVRKAERALLRLLSAGKVKTVDVPNRPGVCGYVVVEEGVPS